MDFRRSHELGDDGTCARTDPTTYGGICQSAIGLSFAKWTAAFVLRTQPPHFLAEFGRDFGCRIATRHDSPTICQGEYPNSCRHTPTP